MIFKLPDFKKLSPSLSDYYSYSKPKSSTLSIKKLFILIFFFSLIILPFQNYSFKGIITILKNNFTVIKPVEAKTHDKEILGFAPYWTINKLDSVDFSTLTTLAYFDLPIQADGKIDKNAQGYITFKSEKATTVFNKAQSNGTKVVVTITQMDNEIINEFLSNPSAQDIAISEIILEIKSHKLNGVNIDFEYVGDPGSITREQYTEFVKNLTDNIREEIPNSHITVSVYAMSAKEYKLYDLEKLAMYTDGIFMMAYDFATSSSDTAMPTAPLYGYKEGKYMYDISTAIEDFLKVMPSEKLILGVPYYGYNYMVSHPNNNVNTQNIYSQHSRVDTYEKNVNSSNPDKIGWDDIGKVGWKAYYIEELDVWRMIYIEDQKSLALKYDMAIDRNLGGVGMWALGFDEGKSELWDVLKEKFGVKIANSNFNKQSI